MVNQASSVKPSTAVLKVCTQNPRYQAGTVSSLAASVTPTKTAAGKASAINQPTTPDVKAASKEVTVARPVFVVGSANQVQRASSSGKGQCTKPVGIFRGNGDSSPAVSKPGEPNKRSRLSGASTSLSNGMKRGAERSNDIHPKLTTSMTSMKLLALSGPSTSSKLKAAATTQNSQLKSNSSLTKVEDGPPLSSSSQKGQPYGATRAQARALQLVNPQPSQSIDVSRVSSGGDRARLGSNQSKVGSKFDAMSSKVMQSRSGAKPKQVLSAAASAMLESIKASAGITLARRSKSAALDMEPEKPSSTRVRKSAVSVVTPVKSKSPPASVLKSKSFKDSEAKAGAPLTTGLFGSTVATGAHRNFPRQSVDFDVQEDATPRTATPSKPPPPVPRLNLAAVLTHSQELNLPHHQPDAVASPSNPSTATAQPSRQSKAGSGSGSMALGSAPQEDHFYMYKSVTPEERRQWEALIKRLPRTESKQVKKLWDALLDARHNCEGMAFRGHRLLDQMKNDFILYKQDSEKKLAEVEFDRQRLAVLLQAKEAPVRMLSRSTSKDKGHSAREHEQATVDEGEARTGKSLPAEVATGQETEGSEELEYRAHIIATSETAHILMKQLMEKEAIQHDLQNQVSDLQKLVYCLANIAKHLLNEQPPRPSPAHLAQWSDFVHKLLQQAAYQAKGQASGMSSTTTVPPGPTHKSSVPHNHHTATPSPTEPPPAPRYRSPRADSTPPKPVVTGPTHVQSPTTSSELADLSASGAEDMDYSPTNASGLGADTSGDLSPAKPFVIKSRPSGNNGIGSHFVVLDQGGTASAGPESPLEYFTSTTSDDCYHDAHGVITTTSMSSIDTSINTPRHSEAGLSDRNHSQAAPTPFASLEVSVMSPVAPLRLANLHLRDRLEQLELSSTTDCSASLMGLSSLTTPNTPSQLFINPTGASAGSPLSSYQQDETLRTSMQSLMAMAEGANQLELDGANKRKRKGEDDRHILHILPVHTTCQVNQRPFPQSNPMFTPCLTPNGSGSPVLGVREAHGYTSPEPGVGERPEQVRGRNAQVEEDSEVVEQLENFAVDQQPTNMLDSQEDDLVDQDRPTRPGPNKSGIQKHSTTGVQAAAGAGARPLESLPFLEKGWKKSVGHEDTNAPDTQLHRLDSFKTTLERLKSSTDARSMEVQKLVETSKVVGRLRPMQLEPMAHVYVSNHAPGFDVKEVGSEGREEKMEGQTEEAEEKGLDSVELPLPNSMPGFGITSLRLA